jgi:hypothetical protein
MIEERLLRPAGVVVAQGGTATQPAVQHPADNQISPASSGARRLSDRAEQAGATGSGRYTPRADAPERSSSVLHKPVITAPEDWRINQGQFSLDESLGALRDWAEDPSNYVYESERNWPSSSGQEAAGEETEIPLTSDPAEAIEDVRERTKAVNDAFQSKNYAEAARLQESIAAAVRLTETAAEGKPGDGTLDALLSLSWYQLCAGQIAHTLLC